MCEREREGERNYVCGCRCVGVIHKCIYIHTHIHPHIAVTEGRKLSCKISSHEDSDKCAIQRLGEHTV